MSRSWNQMTGGIMLSNLMITSKRIRKQESLSKLKLHLGTNTRFIYTELCSQKRSSRYIRSTNWQYIKRSVKKLIWYDSCATARSMTRPRSGILPLALCTSKPLMSINLCIRGKMKAFTQSAWELIICTIA